MRHLLLLSCCLHIGCFTSVISSFDSAYLPQKGQVQARAYSTNNLGVFTSENTGGQRHFGAAAGVGLSNRLTLTAQWERAGRDRRLQIEGTEGYQSYRYFEGGILVGLIDKKLATHVSYGRYMTDQGELLQVIRPKMMYTFKSPRRKMEFSLHMQYLRSLYVRTVEDLDLSDVIFGQNFAISNDLDRWRAIIDLSSSAKGILSAGLGVEYRFGGGKTNLELVRTFKVE